MGTKKEKKKVTVYHGVGILFALGMIGFFCIYLESKKFEVNEYVFLTHKLLTKKYTFVVLSDLHNVEFGKGNERLLKAIHKVHPDAILFAGDMVEAKKGASFQPTIHFIGELAKKYPIYYGMGNHEHKLRDCPKKYGTMYSAFTKAIGKFGVHIMENEEIKIGNTGIKVYGLDLEHMYYRRLIEKKVPEGYLEKKLGKADQKSYNILLAHHPDPFPIYAKWSPDLVLSGHIHGGIVRIPGFRGVLSPQLKLFPKYDRGLFKEGNATMILSKGIGTHTLPVRIFNRAEMIVITLKKKRG